MFFRLKFFLDVFENLGFLKGIIFLIRKKLKINKVIRLNNIEHPISLRPGTSDEKAFMQIFIGNDYDINLSFEPKNIIDGGANIGLASIYLKNKYKDAKIIAIEPDTENVKALKSNVALYDNIFVKQTALWPEIANVKISDKYGLGNWGFVIEANDTEGEHLQLNVGTVTIPDLMREFNFEVIDLLKLDIESAEKQLFGGDYMAWLPLTKVIIIELHDWMVPGCSKAFFSAINSTFNNYQFYQVHESTVIINTDLVSK